MTDDLKSNLEEFLVKAGIEFDAASPAPPLKCFNPAHADPAQFAYLFRDTPSVICPFCEAEWDVFDCAGAIFKEPNIKEQKRIVKNVLAGRPAIDPERAARKAERAASRENADIETRNRKHDPATFPFTILGVGDDGRIAFIGRNERFHQFAPIALTKLCLLSLAPLEWWFVEFGYLGPSGESKLSWDKAIDYIVQVGTNRDFDPSQVRGRGAWREKPSPDHPEGRICYHDGRRTIGEHDSRRLYVRRPQRDIGIEGPRASAELAREIERVTARISSFATPADHVRLLAWAVLAPFAGALPWRPAVLLTGDTKSGKTTILDYVVNPLAEPLKFTGGESTEAGVRQVVGIDACGVTIDEAECDTDKKRRNREALFSLMRMSTSDESPVVAKGTIDGRGQRFQMRSMFLFAAISPEVEATADENRIFRINLKMPDSEKWSELRVELIRVITPQNCALMHARMWFFLPLIIRTAHRFTGLIQDLSGKDARDSLAEGLLQAAYWIGLKGRDGIDSPEITDTEFTRELLALYNLAPPDAQRDANEEILDRLLDERVQVEKPDRGMMSLREILAVVRSGRITVASSIHPEGEPEEASAGVVKHLKDVAARYGLAVTKAGELAVAHNHHEIMRITGHSRGYHRALLRHAGMIDGSKTIWLAEKSRRCVVIGGVFGGDGSAAGSTDGSADGSADVERNGAGAGYGVAAEVEA